MRHGGIAERRLIEFMEPRRLFAVTVGGSVDATWGDLASISISYPVVSHVTSRGLLVVQGNSLPHQVTLTGSPPHIAINGAAVSAKRRVKRVRIDLGSGDDRIDASKLGGVSITVDSGDGDDTILGTGRADHIDAGPGADSVIAGGGKDVVHGGGGWDTIDGGKGDDNLFGDSGNDVLVGGAGADGMHGNGGDDRFFARGDEADASDSISGDAGHDRLINADGDDLWSQSDQPWRYVDKKKYPDISVFDLTVTVP